MSFMNKQGDKLARQRSEDSREAEPKDCPLKTPYSFDEHTLLLRFLSILILISGTGFASDSAVQFYFGGLDDVPAGSVGILVADESNNGFLEPDGGEMIGVKLVENESIGPWDSDDRIIAVFTATDLGFGPDKTGFTGVVSKYKFNWQDRVPVGAPLKFYWFPDNKPGDKLGKWMRYGSFRRDLVGTSGGTIGFVAPDFRKHETIATVTTDAPGGGDFDGTTGIATGLVGIGNFTGQELPERIGDPSGPAEGPDTTTSVLGDEFRGTYVGLVNEVSTNADLGEIAVKIGKSGSFSGRIIVNRISYKLRGSFDENGVYAVELNSRYAIEPLNLALQLATTDGSGGLKINGTIDGASGLAGIIDSHRASFHKKLNPAPWAGRYTMLLPKTEDSPGGDGYALVSVATSGRVTAKFRLGDMAGASDSTYISIDGEWPLSLIYNRRKLGRVAGMLTFRDIPESDFDGVLSWSKRAHTRERFFPKGIAVTLPAVGSAFERVTEGRLISSIVGGWQNTAITFLGDFNSNPGTIYTNWGTDNRFTSYLRDGQRLKISANRKTGYIAGSYDDKSVSPTLNFRFYGVAFQKQSVISGVSNRYRTTEVGSLTIDPN